MTSREIWGWAGVCAACGFSGCVDGSGVGAGALPLGNRLPDCACALLTANNIRRKTITVSDEALRRIRRIEFLSFEGLRLTEVKHLTESKKVKGKG
jgi:hypothetical protein